MSDQWYYKDSYSRSEVSESMCILEENDLTKQYDIDDIKYFTEVLSRKEATVVYRY